MLLISSRRVAPPIASAAIARHPLGPALWQAASAEGILPVPGFSAAPAGIGTAAISTQLNKTSTFRKKFTYPTLFQRFFDVHGKERRRSVRRRKREFESQKPVP